MILKFKTTIEYFMYCQEHAYNDIHKGRKEISRFILGKEDRC